MRRTFLCHLHKIQSHRVIQMSFIQKMNIAFFYGVKRYIHLLCIPGLQITAYPPSQECCSSLVPLVFCSCSGPLAWAAHSECSVACEQGPHHALTMLLLQFWRQQLLLPNDSVSVCPGHLEALPARLDPGVRPEATAHLMSFLSPRNPERNLDNSTYPTLLSSFDGFSSF